jgi:hypothetical protein
MPDPSLGDWLFNDVAQAVEEWFIRGWLGAPRTAQVAIFAAVLLGLVALLIGAFTYPGSLAIVAIGCGVVCILAAVLIVFTIAVIRGE